QLIAVEPDGGFSVVAINTIGCDFFGLDAIPAGARFDWVTAKRLFEVNERTLSSYLERALRNFRQVVDTGQPLETENEFVDDDGTVRWSQNALTPIEHDGRVVRILVTFTDVSELREAESSIEAALTELVSSVVRICESCSNVEDAEGRWLTMSEYVAQHSALSFSHGICPDCFATMRRGH
ncbi:MAG: PAS domain-containing protein, partial [Pseudomonadales bacterium]|nr:PAS domain-containing protein [Pseudomonadales bacterium]